MANKQYAQRRCRVTGVVILSSASVLVAPLRMSLISKRCRADNSMAFFDIRCNCPYYITMSYKMQGGTTKFIEIHKTICSILYEITKKSDRDILSRSYFVVHLDFVPRTSM